MELVYILSGLIVLSFFTFILIEHPYFLVSFFVFFHLYNVNLELPGPLDLRGIISILLFFRLVFFDKTNLDLIKELLVNKYFLVVLLFLLYSTADLLLTGGSLFQTVKSLALNIISLLIGYLTVLRADAKKIVAYAVIVVGIFSTMDLIHSYVVKGALRIIRIIDPFLGVTTTYNHNFFGSICAQALLITFLLMVNKLIKKTPAIILLAIYSIGILISTSRMTLLTIIVSIILILITQKQLNIGLKKIISFGFAGAVFIFIVLISYSYILSAMHLKSEFADQIYWRLVEEPLSLFDEEHQEFEGENIKKGSMKWRINKTFRDADLLLKEKNEVILFGLGSKGYFKIGEILYVAHGAKLQYSSHNFYTNLVSEIGLVGLALFLLFFLFLVISRIKIILKGEYSFSFVYLLLFMFLYSFGGGSDLTDKYAYIIYGVVIAELMAITSIKENEVYLQNSTAESESKKEELFVK